MNITISGLPCSGKSSIANYLAEKYGFKKINAGQIFREEAEKRNLTLNELSNLCKTDFSIDRALDAKIADLGKKYKGQKVIFDSRMAWNFVPQSFKVFIILDEDEMTKRLIMSDRKETEKGQTPEQARKNLMDRWTSENYRYKTLYGVCNLERHHFDYITSTKDKTIEEISEELYNEYIKFKKGFSKNG